MSNSGLQPVSGSERIQALDVVRGFALIGIFLMNVEWFNRPIADLDAGMPLATGGWDIHYLAGWLIHVFVRGKFWTLFSLLFGMGFAVMLGRAERAGRDFVLPYLRRITALAVFGACHFIFLWAGDILFSYAMGAAVLMVVFYGRAPAIAIGILASAGLAAGLQLEWAGGAAVALAIAAAAALFIRSDIGIEFLGRRWHVLTLASWLIALVLLVFGVAGGRLGLGIGALVIAIAGLMATFGRQPERLRTVRFGAFLYLTPFLVMALFGALYSVYPQLKAEPSAEQKVQIQERRDQQVATIAEETRVMTGDSYRAAVEYRAGKFPKQASDDIGFAGLVISMFLIGVWFVRSGVMERTGEHLPLFRKLAYVGLPVGLAMGIVSALVTTSHVAGQNDAQYQLALGLLMAGNLPACLGYASVIVLMLHAGGALAKISVLAPAGRMALTNYLSQSLIQAVFFYGYFLGHWGLGRAWQVLFVFVVYALQVAFSHWWLARFHYGPMEWLWRAITYWQLPPMRRIAVAGPVGA